MKKINIKSFSLITLTGIIFVIVLYLPDSIPRKFSFDTHFWEYGANLRFYLARCFYKYPPYVFFPYSHPWYTMFAGTFYTLLKILPLWKQMFLYNILLLFFTSLVVYEILRIETNVLIISIAIAILFFFQPALFLWSFSGFAYYTGLFFFSLGTYTYFYKEKKFGILFFSILPLIRHELSIFLLPPFIKILREERDKLFLLTILGGPFILYYVIASYVVFKNVFFLFFFHSLACNGNITLGKYFSSTLSKIVPLIHYNPLFWLGFIPLSFNKKLRLLFITSLILFFIPYIDRTLFAPVFLTTIGTGILIHRARRLKSIFIGLLIVVEFLIFIFVPLKPGKLEDFHHFRSYPFTYQWLVRNKKKYDFFLFPARQEYLLWNDKNCNLANKLFFERGKPGVKILPQGMVLSHYSNDLSMLKKYTFILIQDTSFMSTVYFRRLQQKGWKILKIIPQEKILLLFHP